MPDDFSERRHSQFLPVPFRSLPENELAYLRTPEIPLADTMEALEAKRTARKQGILNALLAFGIGAGPRENVTPALEYFKQQRVEAERNQALAQLGKIGDLTPEQTSAAVRLGLEGTLKPVRTSQDVLNEIFARGRETRETLGLTEAGKDKRQAQLLNTQKYIAQQKVEASRILSQEKTKATKDQKLLVIENQFRMLANRIEDDESKAALLVQAEELAKQRRNLSDSLSLY